MFEWCLGLLNGDEAEDDDDDDDWFELDELVERVDEDEFVSVFFGVEVLNGFDELPFP